MDLQIWFDDPPKRTHSMEYGGVQDRRKDKYIRGEISQFPSVKLINCFMRSGKLKVACVKHEPDFHFHPNLLCNVRGELGVGRDNHVDEYGVGTFDFSNETDKSEIVIPLKELCIRHSVQREFNNIKQNWLNNQGARFDPLGLGYGDKKDIQMEYVRLCCQAVFNDGGVSQVLISESIFNGPDDMKIEYWDENKKVNENGNELLYILVRELSFDQHRDNGIFVRFSISNSNSNGFFDVAAEKIHHNYTVVVKIPSYKQITGQEVLDEEVKCRVELRVLGKDHYRSNFKEFTFYPSERIPLKRKFFDDDDKVNRQMKKTHCESTTKQVSFNPNSRFASNHDYSQQQPTTSQAAIQADLMTQNINVLPEFNQPTSSTQANMFNIEMIPQQINQQNVLNDQLWFDETELNMLNNQELFNNINDIDGYNLDRLLNLSDEDLISRIEFNDENQTQ